MKLYTRVAFLLLVNMLMMYSANAQPTKIQHDIKGEEVSYLFQGITMKGYVAYDAAIKTKRPGIVVVHEWWGSNEYVRTRARQLAELGYIAFAADLYGDGKLAEDPKMAADYAMPFYKNPQMAKERIEAAISKLKEYPQTDALKIGGVGYCFGGSMLLNSAKLGIDMKVVVSFHGGLAGVDATRGSTKAALLVCHGGADQFVSDDDIKHFKGNLASMKVFYQMIVYPGATHAFTNPEATANGKKFNMPIEYNAASDQKSWSDMNFFLKRSFGK